MISRKVRRIACYKEGVALAYCEVPLWQVTADNVPVVYDKHSTILGTYGVNILDDVFTSFQLTSELSYWGIDHDEINKKIYKASMCAHRFIAQNGRSVDIQVPHTCGCGIYPCNDGSDRLYAIFTLLHDEIYVLSVDRLPLEMVTKDYAPCATKWLADMLHEISKTMLVKYPEKNIKTFIEEQLSNGTLFRICNAKFLRRIPLEDFRRYVILELRKAPE